MMVGMTLADSPVHYKMAVCHCGDSCHFVADKEYRSLPAEIPDDVIDTLFEMLVDWPLNLLLRSI